MIGRIGTVMVLAALLGACASTDVYRPTGTITAPPAYVTAYRPPTGTGVLWWRGFEDPALDALVLRALSRNLDLAAARSRLSAARALIIAERSDRRPAIDLGANAQLSGGAQGAGQIGATGSGLVLLDPDLSGRLSQEIAAAAANARANEYLVADTQRLVAASVTQQYIELKRSEARLALLVESTALQERTLRIVKLRFGAGLSANLDVRRAAADLARTEAQRGVLELQRTQAARALSVLSGDLPAPLEPLDGSERVMPRFAGGPPVGLPADLLRRRPDILVAEARLAEAVARVGAEQADLLPSLILPGRISIGRSTFTDLFSSLLATISAAIDIPIVDGGRRRAEIVAAKREADARFADYQRTVLSTLAEVDNALVAIKSFEDRNAALLDAIDQSEAAFSQLNALYREGLSSLFDVLDAQRQLIGSREALIDSEAQFASAIARFYAALGAETEPDETVPAGMAS